MIIAMCIEKLREGNSNIISGYILQDQQGNIIEVKPEQLKQAIKNNQIRVINLKLTSDNKLIDNVEKKKSQAKTEPNKNINTAVDKNDIAERTLLKVKTLGLNIIEYRTHQDKKFYLIRHDELKHTLVIPSDITKFTKAETDAWNRTLGTIKVVGGSGLTDTKQMFRMSDIGYLDLSSFDTSNVTDMSHMFEWCMAKTINLSNFNTSKVTNMTHMFKNCNTKSLNLSSFDTSNVIYMSKMFCDSTAPELDVSSFNTTNTVYMDAMFAGADVSELDLTNFDTSKVVDMSAMFYNCKSKRINLSSFTTERVRKLDNIFYHCSNADILATDKKLIDKIQMIKLQGG